MKTAVDIIVTFFLLPWGGIIMMSPMMVAAKGFRDSLSSILLAMLIMGYPVIIFALYKLLGYRYFNMNVNGWLTGFLIAVGVIFLLYNFPSMLINLKRGIPNSGYFVSEKGVYLEGSKITAADPKTFEVLKEDKLYAKDSSHVFYFGKLIDGADAKTFAPVESHKESGGDSVGATDPVFWKDIANVYFSDKVIDGADPKTFEQITGLYAKDDRHIFYQHHMLENANPEKFTFLKGGIATDGTSIFIYNKQSHTPVDLATFEVVENENGDYCRDRNSIYVLMYEKDETLVPVDGADVDTFKPLERSYAVDKNHVYFYGYGQKSRKVIRLEDANPKTFTVGYDESAGSDATDGTRRYLEGEVLKP